MISALMNKTSRPGAAPHLHGGRAKKGQCFHGIANPFNQVGAHSLSKRAFYYYWADRGQGLKSVGTSRELARVVMPTNIFG